MHRLLPTAIALVAIMAATTMAQTAPSDLEARTLYTQADRAYAEGRYELALGLFEEAYSLSERPLILYSIANTLERLGRTEEAIETLERFLPVAPESRREVAEARIAALRERSAQLEQERARREREQAEEIEASVRAEVEAADSEDPPPNRRWVGPTVALVMAAASGAAALGLGIRAQQSSDEAERACQQTSSGALLCPTSASAALARAENRALATDVLWAVSAASALVSVSWFIAARRQREDTEVSVGLGQVSLRHSF